MYIMQFSKTVVKIIMIYMYVYRSTQNNLRNMISKMSRTSCYIIAETL